MSPSTADLRKFLTDYFSDEELTTLCFDYFAEVYNSFASGMSKSQKIQLLIEHVQRREQQPDLLKVLHQQRPEQHAKYLAPQSETSANEQPRSASPGIDVPVMRPQPAADSSRALRVFLCHSTSDKPAVRELYRRLRADGFDPWLDEENLLPGQDWQLEIPKAVRNADVVIVCLSRGSINKAGYVQKEIKFALDVADEQSEGAIFLIPLKLEECEVPERLTRWQWVNFSDSRSYERLTRALQVRATSLGLSIASKDHSPLTPRIGGIDLHGSSSLPAELTDMEQVLLFNVLITYYNLEDIRTLVFGLNIRYDELAGKTKQAKVVSLIDYCFKHRLLKHLFVQVRKEWPAPFK